MVRAVRVHAPGGIEDLRLDDIELPEPGEDEALIRVHAAAITRDELDWVSDRLPAIPSYELSGVLQEGADGMPAGQEVFALAPFDRDGVAADYAVVPVEVLAAKPRSLNHTQAAALPMPGLSAWQALMIHGHLQPGWRVAITGVRGGVGHLAAQLVHSKDAVLVDAGQHCDLLFDTVGGDALAQGAQHAGRIVTIAAEAPGAHYFVVEPNRDQLDEVARLADTGYLVPQIDSTYPLHEAQAAFTRTTTRGKHGKVVFDVNAESRLVNDE
jgi:NADPH:quinone reductase-like Zn-dependent oxidoreductase